jgi:hypothetical protein
MNTPRNVPPRQNPTLLRHLITTLAALALVAAAWLLVWGLFVLAAAALGGWYLDASSGWTFWPEKPRPPTPSELANKALNTAEVARAARQGITMIGLGAVLLVTSLLAISAARRPHS